MTLDDKDLKDALATIAHTPSGRVLYLFLQKTRSDYYTNPTADALREHHGRRTFAAELMAGMAEGIRESHGGRDPTTEPITFVAREPTRVAGRESPRAHIARTDTELTAGTPGAGGPDRAA